MPRDILCTLRTAQDARDALTRARSAKQLGREGGVL